MASVRITLAVIVAFTLIALAQEQEQLPVFKGRADVVLIPVVVHDKQGKHVPGLKAEDFTIEDNGAKQNLASVDEVAPDNSVPQPPPELSADVRRGVLFTNQVSNPAQPKQLMIFAIDLVNAPFADTEQGRRAMLSFIASHMTSNRTMGLVTIESGRVRLLHAFTQSPSVLNAALSKVTAVTTSPATQDTQQAQAEGLSAQQTFINSEANTLTNFIAGQVSQANEAFVQATTARNVQNIASALESLRLIASWVAGVPGRKELVWLTGDIPFVSGEGRISLGKLDQQDYDRTMKALADANVAVYPVDVRGVVPQSAYSRTYRDPGQQQAQAMATAMDGSPAGISRRSDALQRGVVHMEDAHEVMNYFANLTGGRAYYNRNDIPRVLDDAATDASRYYMLTYALDRKNAKPGWHKLKVTVHRDGVTARARNGFFVSKPGQEESASAKQTDERTALTSPFDYTALPVTLRWGDIAAKGDKKKVGFQLYVPSSAGLVSSDQPTLDLDFLAAALTMQGEMAGSSSRALKTTLKQDGLQKIAQFGLTYVSDVEVKPGDYTVRVVVRDNQTGRIGSVTAPLKVAP